MSIQTLYSAATGMSAMETKLDVIANNLANMETTGFKKERANFESLFYRHEMYPGAEDVDGNFTATGISVGLGTKVSSVQTMFDKTGAFQDTGRELDVAIEGKGFFQVLEPGSGNLVYTRAGNFNINSNGQLVVGSAYTGRLLEPPIEIPEDTRKITISANGIVSVHLPNTANAQQVGQLELATFINPEGLEKLGENLYDETDASGPPRLGTPGEEDFGLLRQNMLETSNVEPVQELIDLITTQRAFELNSQVVTAGDSILQTITSMKRY